MRSRAGRLVASFFRVDACGGLLGRLREPSRYCSLRDW